MNKPFQVGLFAVAVCILQWNQLAIGGDSSGRWKGSWTAAARPGRPAHGGTLNVRLRPGPDNSYRGVFSGRFAVVIPYVYRAKVYAVPGGLYSSKRLGPFGQYNMFLRPQSGRLDGSWSASMRNGSVHTGTIRLQRRR